MSKHTQVLGTSQEKKLNYLTKLETPSEYRGFMTQSQRGYDAIMTKKDKRGLEFGVCIYRLVKGRVY